MKRLWTLSVPVALVFILALAGIAFAHAKIDNCTPAGGETVATAPAQVVCVMTEEIDTKLSTISVTDASGAEVDKKDGHVDLDDPDRKTLVVSLDPAMVSDGIYTVTWHVVTPDDGGITEGTFQFIVGSAAATPQPTTQVIMEEEDETPEATVTTAAETTPTIAATEAVSPTVTATPSPIMTEELDEDEHGDDDAAHYCTDKGGTVVERYPTYNTNADPSQWLRLSGERDFCTFLSEADSTGFQSQISIDLETLYSDQPTLAVLAYLEPVALPAFTGANPSTLYCQKLGGTDIWGGMNNAAGGGWVTEAPDSATNFQVVGMCVFPDMSAIDSWGLTYKANGVVRGADLTTLVRYQPTVLPPVFVSASSGNEPAPGTQDKTLTQADNNSSVTLKVGDTLTVQLPSNPSTGYSWQYVDDNENILRPIGKPTFDLGPGATPMPGAGGTETFNFGAVSAGQTKLTLVYVRPWETNVTPTPDDTFTVDVTVQ